MTVQELIDKLSQFPKDMVVLMNDPEWGYEDVHEVKQKTVIKYISEQKNDEDVWEADIAARTVYVGDSFVGIC